MNVDDARKWESRMNVEAEGLDNKNNMIDIIIFNLLKQYEFPDDYIKYSSYKYKLFEECMMGSNYNSICNDTNIYFDEKERKVLFEIIEQLGYKIKHIDDYSFYMK